MRRLLLLGGQIDEEAGHQPDADEEQGVQAVAVDKASARLQELFLRAALRPTRPPKRPCVLCFKDGWEKEGRTVESYFQASAMEHHYKNAHYKFSKKHKGKIVSFPECKNQFASSQECDTHKKMLGTKQ